MSNLAFRLLDTSAFNLLLNTNLSQFSVVSEVLSFHNIPFGIWTPDADLPVNIVELSFTRDCKFFYVYLLAYIFKDYGLKYVCPTRKINQTIRLGTYLYEAEFPEQHALAESMAIDSFLFLDPKLDTQYVIDNLFENRYSDDLEEEQDSEEEYDDNDHDYHSPNYEDHDWERETFDAMTDGQLGDYDDFEGNIDDVRTWAGRD